MKNNRTTTDEKGTNMTVSSNRQIQTTQQQGNQPLACQRRNVARLRWYHVPIYPTFSTEQNTAKLPSWTLDQAIQ